MRFAVALVLTLAPAAPALADMTCTIERQCGGGTCEAFAGGPMLLEQTGDAWQVTLDGQVWQGHATTAQNTGDEVSIVLPPQNGMSGLITVLPGGDGAFSVHAASDGGLVAITGEATCISAEGG